MLLLGYGPNVTSVTNVNVNHGEPGVVTCTANSVPYPEISFTSESGINIQMTSDNKVDIETRTRQAKVPKMTKDMNLKCVAENVYGNSTKLLIPDVNGG